MAASMDPRGCALGLRWASDAAAMECGAASLRGAVMRRDAALVVLDCKVPLCL